MAIAEDRQGDLWVSTHNAVLRFRVGRGSFDAYNLYDRMRNAILSEATALTLPDGSVLFVGGRKVVDNDGSASVRPRPTAICALRRSTCGTSR